MLKKIDLIELFNCISKLIKDCAGIDCYDYADNIASPFYMLELISIVPSDTKTMFCDTYTYHIHSIAKPNNSSVDIYEMLNKLNEALTQEIQLDDAYTLLEQVNGGLLIIKTDETEEKHAVTEFRVKISYGFKIK